MKYKITIGASRYDKEWKVIDVSWLQLVKRLSEPKRTTETVAEYKKMSKAERLKAKDVGGFVGGELITNGERKNNTLKSRSILSIDLDGNPYKNKYPDVKDITNRLRAYNCAAVIHSTHSSTPEEPRLRVIIPLSREVSPDEYTPIALRVADSLGMEYVDQTCRQAARLMFWSSLPHDALYIFEELQGNPLEADGILSTYMDWRDVGEYPGTNEALRAAAARKRIRGDVGSGRAEDPSTKEGIVGAFCAVYNIEEAINAFNLPYKKYSANRYTYSYGSSVGGAVVYDDCFLFSNHATDPCSLQCCNAFDLVRIHKFGHIDNTQNEGTPINRLNSYRAMVDFIDTKLPKVKVEALRRAQEHAEKTFEGIDPVEADNALKSRNKRAEDIEDATQKEEPQDITMEQLISQLETRSGRPVTSPANYANILALDSRLRERLYFDDFSKRKIVCKPLPWDKSDTKYPREWTDTDSSQMAIWFSKNYQMHNNKTAMLDAVECQLKERAIHPVRAWFASLPEWDGVERVDNLFIKYLGAPDMPISRTITHKHLVAAVMRIFQPGSKYDQVLCFCGGEGIGKSTIIRLLANGWYMDSIINVGDKDAYQNLSGNWLIEMSEFADMESKTVASYKSFISSDTDRYRPSYGRETVVVPRQCVFFGTTNEKSFLKGRTGNRRFWILDCAGGVGGVAAINEDIPRDLEQIWAEAYHYYKQGTNVILTDKEKADMDMLQKAHEDILNDDNIEIIKEYIVCAKPYNWEDLSIKAKQDWYRGRAAAVPTGQWSQSVAENYYPKYICTKEIAMVVLDQKPSDKSRFSDKSLFYICNNISCLKYTNSPMRFGREIGVQKAFEIIREDNDLPM